MFRSMYVPHYAPISFFTYLITGGLCNCTGRPPFWPGCIAPEYG